jgi:hypothetical protein
VERVLSPAQNFEAIFKLEKPCTSVVIICYIASV